MIFADLRVPSRDGFVRLSQTRRGLQTLPDPSSRRINRAGDLNRRVPQRRARREQAARAVELCAEFLAKRVQRVAVFYAMSL
jgi:hypothetical protein